MFICYDKNMNVLSFPKGATPLDIFISSIQKRSNTSNVEGVNGYIDYGSEYDTRQINLTIKLDADDTQDYRLLRDEVYAFFNAHDYFYVSEAYQKGKRYRVKVSESFIPDRHNRWISSIDIPLEMAGNPIALPFSESIGTTADIDSNGLRYSDELWSYGMGLTTDFREDDDPFRYTIHAKEGEYFRIYNAGNVVVHPFQMDLKITIKDVVGSDGRVHLRNQTNHDYIRINDEDITEDDVFVFDGANVTKNGTAFLRNTERTFISLNRKWNRFQLYYCESATIEFDFRFYYL